MKTIIHFELIDTGLQKMSREERICRTGRWTVIVHGWGTDANSAFDHLCQWLQEYGYKVTPELLFAISEQWNPTADEGDGETTFYHLYMHIGCVNQRYKTVYETDYQDEDLRLENLQHQVEAEYRAAIRQEELRRQPTPGVALELSPEVYAHIRQNVLSSPLCLEITRLEQTIKMEQMDREACLMAMSPRVMMVPDSAMHVVDSVFYCQGRLQPSYEMLQRLGFKTHIRKTSLKLTGFDAIKFELWANCPEWMFDAACRQI